MKWSVVENASVSLIDVGTATEEVDGRRALMLFNLRFVVVSVYCLHIFQCPVKPKKGMRCYEGPSSLISARGLHFLPTEIPTKNSVRRRRFGHIFLALSCHPLTSYNLRNIVKIL